MNDTYMNTKNTLNKNFLIKLPKKHYATNPYNQKLNKKN